MIAPLSVRRNSSPPSTSSARCDSTEIVFPDVSAARTVSTYTVPKTRECDSNASVIVDPDCTLVAIDIAIALSRSFSSCSAMLVRHSTTGIRASSSTLNW